MRKTKSERRKPKRTRSRTISANRLSFNSLEPRNLLAAVTPAPSGLDVFVLVPVAVETQVHCKSTEENLCGVDLDDNSEIFNFDIEAASENDNDDGDSRPPSLRADNHDEPSVDNPITESPEVPPDVPSYPQEIRQLVAEASIRSTPTSVERSNLRDRASLSPITILPVTETSFAMETDVFSSEVKDSFYFLPTPAQTASAPIFRSDLIMSHQTFSVIAINPALKSSTLSHSNQSESRYAEYQSSKTPQKTLLDAGKGNSESGNSNQQRLAEAAGPVVRTITTSTVSQFYLENGEHIETSPSTKQTVAPILPASPRMPEDLINEDRPLIESKDGALARNLESTMMLVIFYRKPHRLPQSDRNLAQSPRIGLK